MPITKSASHLSLRGTTYSFRMNLPEDVRSTLGRRELKISLQTGRLRDARSLATRLSAIGQNLVEQARNGELEGMLDQEIQRLVNRVLRRALDEDHRLRIEHAQDYWKERHQRYLDKPYGIGDFHKRHSRCALDIRLFVEIGSRCVAENVRDRSWTRSLQSVSLCQSNHHHLALQCLMVSIWSSKKSSLTEQTPGRFLETTGQMLTSQTKKAVQGVSVSPTSRTTFIK